MFADVLVHCFVHLCKRMVFEMMSVASYLESQDVGREDSFSVQ